MKHKLLIMLLLLLSGAPCRAQEDSLKLKVLPAGRLLLDGGLNFSSQKEMFKDGVAIPDVRLGVKVAYGRWSARIDVGFAYNKVGLKDLYLQYDFDRHNMVRGGSFIHQYGLQSAIGSSSKSTFEAPLSYTAFCANRQIGAMYVHSEDKYFGTFSAHVEPQSIVLTPNQSNRQGYGLLTRQVYRPMHTDGTVLQVGMSAGFLTPQTAGEGRAHDSFSLHNNFPTSVVRVTALEADISGAMNQWKFTPELLLAHGPVALETQYFFNRVNMREQMHSFTGQGAYAILRGILTGGSYVYSMTEARLKDPSPRQLELSLMYSYACLTDPKAQYKREDGKWAQGIFGGRANNFSATVTYYINKYILARLNYTYTHRWDASELPTLNLSTLQARIQIMF